MASYSDLWKALSSDDRNRAAEAFWTDKALRSQQQSALELMAKRYNFRLKSLKNLPEPRKAKLLIELPSLPPAVIMAVLTAFHLTYRREMLVDFLDALAIPHENGTLSEGAETTKPTAESIPGAIEKLKAKYAAHDVDIYLEALYLQDPEMWKELQPFLALQTAGG